MGLSMDGLHKNSKELKTYDIAVVGGGLAGLATAIEMANYGKSVVLFEKNQYPFHRVCGEYISNESWDYLNRLGLSLENENLPKITKLHISSPSGKLLQHPMNPGGFGISRYKLDSMMAHQAQRSGAEILTGKKVTSVESVDDHWQIHVASQTYIAKIAIGSFGKRANLDNQLQRDHVKKRKSQSVLTNYVAVKYHVKADLPSDLIQLHNFVNGYCGISKIEDDRYCMCYLTTAKNLENCNNDIGEMETKLLSQNPFLKDYLNRFDRLYDKPLTIAQVNFSSKKMVENGMLMVGDAAGLITPLCGNGMSMALRGASLVSPLLNDYLNGNGDLKYVFENYQLLWNKEFKTRLKAGRVFQSLFGNKLMTEMVIALLRHSPKVMNKLVQLTHGESF